MKKGKSWFDYTPRAEREARTEAYRRAYRKAIAYGHWLDAHQELVPNEKLIQYTDDESGLFELLDSVGLPYPPRVPVQVYGKMIVDELDANRAQPGQLGRLIKALVTPLKILGGTLRKRLIARERSQLS